MNILESRVMNYHFKNLNIETNNYEKAGIVAVNLVRMLNFKPFLRIDKDRESLLNLQYAFFLEKKKRFHMAAKKYAELEKILQNSLSNDYAFVLLHHGYCLALSGEREKSIDRLKTVEILYNGTHFADSASLMLSVLSENKIKDIMIEKKYTDGKEKGIAYFKTGQFNKAIFHLEKGEKLSGRDKFILARSYEESGRVKKSIPIYYKVINNYADMSLKKKATRRLLILGKFFDGGISTIKFAIRQSIRNGDREAIDQIRQANKLHRKPVLIENLANTQIKKEGAKQINNKTRKRIILELTNTFPEEYNHSGKTLLKRKSYKERNILNKLLLKRVVEREIKKQILNRIRESEAKKIAVLQKQELARKRKLEENEKRKEENSPVIKKSQVKITFMDGRVIYGNKIKMSDGRLIIQLEDSRIVLPYSFIKEIRLKKYVKLQSTTYLYVQFENEKEASVISIRRIKEGIELIGLDGIKTVTQNRVIGISLNK